MKIIIPKSITDTLLAKYKKPSIVVTKLMKKLTLFQQYLLTQLNIFQTNGKLTSRTNYIKLLPWIKWDSDLSSQLFTTRALMVQFIMSLSVTYDNSTDTYCFEVHDTINCKHTKTSLTKLIRLVEYGSANLPPLPWLIQGWRMFKTAWEESIQNGKSL